MDGYNFIPIFPKLTGKHSNYERINVSKYGITITTALYERMDEPEHVVIAVDVDRAAILLTPSEGGPGTYTISVGQNKAHTISVRQLREHVPVGPYRVKEMLGDGYVLSNVTTPKRKV